MSPSQTLPPAYQKVGTLDISKNERLLLLLNLAGLLVLIAAGWLFFRAMFWLHPSQTGGDFRLIQVNSLGQWGKLAAVILILTVLHIILHETIHGIFFWLFTRSRPRFAFRWAYAYAAAPDWYIPRDSFLVTTLAPLVLITLGGLLIFWIAPTSWLLPTWYIISMNAAGAVGDLMVAGWLLRQPPTCLAQDRGDAVTLYIPETPA